MTIYRCTPEEAWRKYIRPALGAAAWVEDSSVVGTDVRLSKREVLSLILISHLLQSNGHINCLVGFDTEGIEPNDGFVARKDGVIHVESKLVAQYDERSVLDAISETYDKYERRGTAYGSGRELLVFANRASGHAGLTKVSSLRDHILAKGKSPFDRVFLGYCRAIGADGQFSFGVTEAFPGKGFAHVNVNVNSGEAAVQIGVPFDPPLNE